MGYNWPPNKKAGRHKFNVDTRLNRLAGDPRGSKLERAVHQILKLREAAGEIVDIKQQARVHLGDGIYWNVDFSFLNIRTNTRIWAEAKGVKCGRYRICLKLWEGGRGPGPLEVWEGTYSRPQMKKLIIPA